MVKFISISAKRSAPLIYENIRDDPHVPPDFTVKDVQRRLSGWALLGVFEGDSLIGVVSLNGNRLHLDFAPAWRGKWTTRSVIRQGLDICFRAKPFLDTSIDETNVRAIRLAERVGFKELGHSHGYRHYRMKKTDLDASFVLPFLKSSCAERTGNS